MQIEGKLFDEDTSKAKEIILLFQKDGVLLKQGNETLDSFGYDELKISSRVANTTRIIEFPNGAVFHTKDNDTVDEALKTFRKKRFSAHIFENNTKLALFSLIMIVLTTLFFLTIGSSVTAKYLAKITPYVLEKEISQHTLNTLNKYLLKDSNLSKEKKAEVLKVFERVTNNDPKYHLYFKRGIGENAFALPSGDIVITDELIDISKGDMDMIYGVLAHEKGHVVYKHSMQMVIKASIVSALVTYFTGDASSLAATAGASLINAKYSRGFEQEADEYAKEQMLKEGISPKHLADFFIMMEKKYKDRGGDNFFASHPSSKKRIENLLK